MSRRILLAGAGQLGSRYLQGMAEFEEPLEIWVLDPAAASLERARQRWSEVTAGENVHSVRYIQGLDGLPDNIDLAIVASTADVRPSLVTGIVAQVQVSNWVLEKVLAQSLEGLGDLSTAIGATPAWVNTSRPAWFLYRRLRAALGSGAVQARFEGIRGLACNAIHFIDLVARWNGAAVSRVDTQGLEAAWFPAKRPGFQEVKGTLDISFTDGSSLYLSSDDGAGGHTGLIRNGQEWQIFETLGYAVSVAGERIEGGAELQSAVTAPLMADIFAGRECGLPTLAQSCGQHAAFLRALQAHRAAGGRGGSILPIT